MNETFVAFIMRKLNIYIFYTDLFILQHEHKSMEYDFKKQGFETKTYQFFAFFLKGKHPDGSGGGGWSSSKSGLLVPSGPKTFNSEKHSVSII